MPMQRENYPVDWPAIARLVKEAAGWHCQACGVACKRPGDAPFLAYWLPVLTVAHADPNSYGAEAATVWALCAPCHLRYDAPFATLFRRRRQRQRQQRAGQLFMEWAA